MAVGVSKRWTNTLQVFRKIYINVVSLPWLTAVLWWEAGKYSLRYPTSACCWLLRGLVVSSAGDRNASEPAGAKNSGCDNGDADTQIEMCACVFVLPHTGHQRTDVQIQPVLKHQKLRSENWAHLQCSKWEVTWAKKATHPSSSHEILPYDFLIRSQVSTCATEKKSRHSFKYCTASY